MGSTESPQGRLTAWMEAALAEAKATPEYQQALTTTYTRATPSTQSTTPSFKLDSSLVRVQLSTSQISRVSSAPTSSNTLGLGGSLFLVEYKTIEGDRIRTFEVKADAVASFKEFNKLYRFVTLSEETTTTTKVVLRDSQNPGA